MKKRYVFVGMLLLFTGFPGKAQQRRLIEIAEAIPSPDWLHLREDLAINPERIFINFKDNFGLLDDDRMELEKTEFDNLGFTHYRYRQYYKNLPVQGGEYIVHAKNGIARKANGKMLRGFRSDVIPTVNQGSALQTALEHVGADRYKWEDAEEERMLKKQKSNPDASYYPVGKLVIAKLPGRKEFIPENFLLAWEFEIHDLYDDRSQIVYVDAKTGQFVNNIPLVYSCDPGTAATTWHGNRTIQTDFDGNNFILWNDCSNAQIRTRNWNGGGIPIEYSDTDNTWNTANQQAAVTSHWVTEQAQNYFNTIHGRDGYDGSGGDINVFNEALINESVNNAAFNIVDGAGRIKIGPGNTSAATDDFNTIDIVGHEFAHGVTRTSANLIYQEESGALNESFSDIFGTAIERWTENNMNPDWLIGEDRGAVIRSMSNPNLYNDPDTYSGTNWVSTANPDNMNDHGGVHTNSGVQNFWFFLLSNGGNGTNDNGDAYMVTGIGLPNARSIAYRNLTVYLTSNSDYADARQGAIDAAEDLYGDCSQQVAQTVNAWYAVGVGTAVNITTTVCGSLNGVQHLNGPTISTGSDCVQLFTTVENGANVVLEAGVAIYLKKEFKATNGCEFRAFVGNCINQENIIPDNPDFEDKIAVQSSVYNGKIEVQKNRILVYPNPSSGLFTFEYTLEAETEVSLSVYDTQGRKVEQLLNKTRQKAGTHRASFDASRLKNDVYMYLLEAGTRKESGKLMKAR